MGSSRTGVWHKADAGARQEDHADGVCRHGVGGGGTCPSNTRQGAGRSRARGSLYGPGVAAGRLLAPGLGTCRNDGTVAANYVRGIFSAGNEGRRCPVLSGASRCSGDSACCRDRAGYFSAHAVACQLAGGGACESSTRPAAHDMGAEARS